VSNLRAALTFVVVLIIVLLAMFQMRLRGYEEIARLGPYVLYENTDVTCEDQLVTIDEVEIRVVCDNAWLLKSGLSEYTIAEALREDILSIDELRPYVTFE
jgi:hypothetical protein